MRARRAPPGVGLLPWLARRRRWTRGTRSRPRRAWPALQRLTPTGWPSASRSPPVRPLLLDELPDPNGLSVITPTATSATAATAAGDDHGAPAAARARHGGAQHDASRQASGTVSSAVFRCGGPPQPCPGPETAGAARRRAAQRGAVGAVPPSHRLARQRRPFRRGDGGRPHRLQRVGPELRAGRPFGRPAGGAGSSGAAAKDVQRRRRRRRPTAARRVLGQAGGDDLPQPVGDAGGARWGGGDVRRAGSRRCCR